MKYNQIRIIFSIAAVIFSSCGSISISQKRYSRGLNIDWFAAKEDKATTRKSSPPKIKKVTVQANGDENKRIINPDGIKQIEPIQNSTVQSDLSQTVLESHTIRSYKQSSSNNKGVRHYAKTVVKDIKTKIKSYASMAPVRIGNVKTVAESHDSDVNFLILIILALIIPPLAVFLYFGELNIHFWINLILCLLGGGIGLAVGYWGIAIIHALLVVFGIFG